MIFNFRIDDKTKRNLDRLAEKHHRSKADVIRLLINFEAEDGQ